MTSFSGVTRLVLLVAGSLVLSGCGIFGGSVDMELPEAVKQKCPPVGIVAYTGELTKFAGEGRERSDVAYQAEISRLQMECADAEDGQGLYAAISFDISATRGPAATSNSIQLPYFVAVTRGNEAVLEKTTYTSAQTFDSSGRTAEKETIKAYVPLGADGEILDLEVLIGFQLSRDELGYNVAR